MLPFSVIRKHDHLYLKQIAILLSFIATGFVTLYFIDQELLILALLMAKVDLFAFGGGFASVPLMLHEVVNVRGWLESKTFMDGIALGQITPGPIVITATFVGYLSHGLAGAVVSTLAIFTPSLLLVVLLVPCFDRLKTSQLVIRATRGILSSFVGLLFYVTINFLTVVSWDRFKLLLVTAALVALFKKVSILHVVPIAATVSLLIF
jgi:chromate transporter